MFFDRLKIIITATVVRITPRINPPNKAPSIGPMFDFSMYKVYVVYKINTID